MRDRILEWIMGIGYMIQSRKELKEARKLLKKKKGQK